MYFANPWGLLGLLALPTIVALHLFRRRFPPLYVAGAHLWGAESRVAEAGRRRDRLPLTPSLLLELLAALVLTFALSDPRFDQTAAALHLVAVLDDSASMQATPPGRVSFRQTAIAELKRRAEAAGREARLTLLRSGLQPTLLGTPAMRWTEAEAALATWTPTSAGHDFHPAWDEAVQLVGPKGRFLFLTDHPPSPSAPRPAGMEVVAVGEPLGNVAITAASWTPGQGDGPGAIFLRMANLGGGDVDVDAVASAGSQAIFEQRVRLPSRSELPLELPARAGLGRVTVRLRSTDDPLAVDDAVTLLEPQVRIVRVAVDLAPDTPEFRLVRKALDTLPGLVWTPPEQADLVIADATTLPPSDRHLWWFGIGPLNRGEAFRQQAVDLIGPYIVERQHPLLDGVTLGGVVWGGVQGTDLRLSPLISVDRTIVLGRLEGTLTTAWVMNIDLSRSNIGDSPDWPILLANLVALRRDALPGLRRWNYRLGESVQFRVPGKTGADTDPPVVELSLLTPSGRARSLLPDRNDVVETPTLDQPGVYRIVVGEQTLGEFAVNFFDPVESNLVGLATAHEIPPTDYEPSRISLDNPFSWLIATGILLALAALLLDWHWLQRPNDRQALLPADSR